MVVQIRSAALAALAAGCGLGLYHFDNWYETLANAWVKVCLDYAASLAEEQVTPLEELTGQA